MKKLLIGSASNPPSTNEHTLSCTMM